MLSMGRACFSSRRPQQRPTTYGGSPAYLTGIGESEDTDTRLVAQTIYPSPSPDARGRKGPFQEADWGLSFCSMKNG